MLNKTIKLTHANNNKLVNIKTISKSIIRELKKMAGWNDLNGWLLPNGQIFKIQRGETHYETAIRYIKQNIPQPKQFIRQFKQTVEDIEGEGENIINYDEVYKFIANKLNLIRVWDDGKAFSTIISETNFNRIAKFLKENMNNNLYVTIYIDDANDIYNNYEFNMEQLEDANYNINKAVYMNNRNKKMMSKYK